MFDSVYSIALDILGKIGGDTSKRYLSTYDIALAILGVLGGDTTKKFDSVYSILLDIYRARFGSALSGMDSSYSILEEINKSFDPSDTTHYDSSYSILVSIDGQPGLIGHVFSIVTDAANTVIINGVETRSVSVREGENVVWSVERRGYVSQSGTYTMGGEDYTETVTLVKEQYTFSIVAAPADATVTINGEVRSSITAEFETVITWSVVREGYTSQSGTYVLVENHSETVSLVINQYTFSIVATPADATVMINGEQRTSITADYGTSITWEVSKEGYTTQSNTETLTGDTTRNITLTEVQYTFTIVPTPADATVMINGVQQSSVTVSDGTTLNWEVSKTGYTTQTGSYTINGADHTENVTLTGEGQYVFTIVPTPADATVMINDVEQSSVAVSDGTTLTWEVSAFGFDPQTGSYTINGADHTENVTLVANMFMIRGTATDAPEIYYNGESALHRGNKMTVSYDPDTGEFIAFIYEGLVPTSMAYAAYAQGSITSINYVGDLSRCTSIQYMFSNCANMTDFNADISITGGCKYDTNIFTGCSSLKVINIPNGVDYSGSNRANIMGRVLSIESIYCRGTRFDSNKSYSGKMFDSTDPSAKYIEVQDQRQVGRCEGVADGAILKLWDVINQPKLSNDGVSSINNNYLPVAGPVLQTGTTTYDQAYATEGVFNIDITALDSTYVDYLKNVLARYMNVQNDRGVKVYGYRYTRIWVSKDQYWENDFDLDKSAFFGSGQYKKGHFPLNSWTLKTGTMPSNA